MVDLKVFKKQLILLELRKEEILDITIQIIKDCILVFYLVTTILHLSNMAMAIFYTGDTLQAECLYSIFLC